MDRIGLNQIKFPLYKIVPNGLVKIQQFKANMIVYGYLRQKQNEWKLFIINDVKVLIEKYFPIFL